MASSATAYSVVSMQIGSLVKPLSLGRNVAASWVSLRPT